MDPNNPGQTPEQTPPPAPWGQTPPPPAQWGQPPVEGQPGYGAPVAPGWSMPAQATKSSSSRLPRIVGGLVSIVVVIAIGIVGYAIFGAKHGGVQFSLSSSQNSSCSWVTPVTTVAPDQEFYVMFDLKDTMNIPDSYTITVTKDGKVVDEFPQTADQKFNCYYFQDTVTLADPGTYKFTFTHNGKVEAEGTLTVK